jgi:hypothetical protein
MLPAPLLAGPGEHLADRGPEPQGIIANREHRREHAAGLQPRSGSSPDSVDSRCRASSAMSSLLPSARNPIITTRHTLR